MNKIEKIRNAFTNFDVLLVTNELNIRYLSGVNYTDGFLLVFRDKAYLLADGRYIELAKNTADKNFEVVLYDKPQKEYLNKYIPSGAKVGFEDTTMTYSSVMSLKEQIPNNELVPVGNLIEKIRNYKDEFEKDCIVKAQRIAEKALDELLGIINPDTMTEIDVAIELETRMRKYGSEGPAFETIAVSGVSSSLPHGVPSNVKLRNGFLTMDFGAKYNGYCSDMTRTISIGKPTDEMVKIYNTVLNAQLAGINAMGPNVKCVDADKAARDIIDATEFKGTFTHSLGHGVGLYIHEPIRVSMRSTQILEPGFIVTAEPGIYLEGKCGVRIEDMIYIKENGIENLTKAPKELIIV